MLHPTSFLVGPSFRSRSARPRQKVAPPPEASHPLPEFAPEDSPDFRADLVARIRRQIAEGTYGTQEQWEIALDRLMRYLDEAG